MKDLDFEAYCERLESEFFRQKGRAGTLSPADFHRTREWFDAGVELAAALEGVGDAFASVRGGRHGADEEVNGLAYCEPFVERAIARRRRVN